VSNVPDFLTAPEAPWWGAGLVGLVGALIGGGLTLLGGYLGRVHETKRDRANKKFEFFNKVEALMIRYEALDRSLYRQKHGRPMPVPYETPERHREGHRQVLEDLTAIEFQLSLFMSQRTGKAFNEWSKRRNRILRQGWAKCARYDLAATRGSFLRRWCYKATGWCWGAGH
jgi:hypothetical protein